MTFVKLYEDLGGKYRSVIACCWTVVLGTGLVLWCTYYSAWPQRNPTIMSRSTHDYLPRHLEGFYSLQLHSSELCPVSSLIDQESNLYSYPTDDFNPDAIVRGLLAVECGVIDINSATKETLTNKTCGNSYNFCPIHQQNILFATETSKTLNRGNISFHSIPFCTLYEDLKSTTETVESNIVVFGGSVTSGVFTQGCSSDWKQLCPFNDYLCKHCAWPARFGEWISASFPNASISTHNLARNGHGSLLAVDLVKKWMQEKNIRNLTKHDIVFLGKFFNI